MSLEKHVEELAKRHEFIDHQIKKIASHPAVNVMELKRLKQEKLKLKDTLFSYQSHTTSAKAS